MYVWKEHEFLVAEMFAPFFEQTLKLLDDNQIENEENIGDI